MVEIKQISCFTSDDLAKLGHYGYKATEKYVVERYDINNELVFRLRKEKMSETVQKDWDKLESDLEFYSKLLKQGYSYGAYIDSNLVGVIIMDHVDWNNTLFVRTIHISDKHHNQGIGSLLLDKAKEIAKENSFRIIALETQNTNVNAIEFYKKNGFEIDSFDLSLYDNNYPNNEVAFFMKHKV